MADPAARVIVDPSTSVKTPAPEKSTPVPSGTKFSRRSGGSRNLDFEFDESQKVIFGQYDTSTPVDISGVSHVHRSKKPKKVRFVDEPTTNRDLSRFLKKKEKTHGTGKNRCDNKDFYKRFGHLPRGRRSARSDVINEAFFNQDDDAATESLPDRPISMGVGCKPKNHKISHDGFVDVNPRKAFVEPFRHGGSTITGQSFLSIPVLSRSCVSDYLGFYSPLEATDFDSYVLSDPDWFEFNGPRITDQIMDGTIDWEAIDAEEHISDDHVVHSSINGANGEATGTDDLDEIKLKKAGAGYVVTMPSKFITEIGCTCDDKDHYHVGERHIPLLTRAHKSFLKRKLKRDGAKSTSKVPSKEDARKMKLLVFTVTSCKKKGCNSNHMHIDDDNVRRCGSDETFFVPQAPDNRDMPMDEEDDEPIRTTQGEKNRSASNIRMTETDSSDGTTSPQPDGAKSEETSNHSKPDKKRPTPVNDLCKIYVSRDAALSDHVSENALSGPLVLLRNRNNTLCGIVGVMTLSNDGLLNGVPNSCFFITLAQILQGIICPIPIADLRERFQNRPGEQLDMDISYNDATFARILGEFGLKVYVWQAIPLDTALIYCSAVVGEGPHVRHIIAYEAHFEMVVGFEFAPVVEGHLFTRSGGTEYVCPVDSSWLEVVSRPCFEATRDVYYLSNTIVDTGVSPTDQRQSRSTPTPSASLRSALLYMTENGGDPQGISQSHSSEFSSFDSTPPVRTHGSSSTLGSSAVPPSTSSSSPSPPPPTTPLPGTLGSPHPSQEPDRLKSQMSTEISFYAADHFTSGLHPGYTYKVGLHGLGYYFDSGPRVSTCCPPPRIGKDVVTIDDEPVADEIGPWISSAIVEPAGKHVIGIGGDYFDTVRCVDLYSSVSVLEQTNPGVMQWIQDSLFSYFYTGYNFALPESTRGIQGYKNISTKVESRPTLLTKVVTLGFAENMVVDQPTGKVELLDKSYFSVSRGLIFLDLAEKLSKENNGIGSYVNGDFWSWSISKMRAQAKAISSEYFSLQKHLDLRVDDHTEHSFVSVTMNTIAYTISNEVKNCSNISMHMPSSLGKNHFGRTNKNLRFGGVPDTFMGVIRANGLMRRGVGIGTYSSAFINIITRHETRPAGVYFEGLTRMLPTRCEKKMDWKFNNKYLVIRGKNFITSDHYISFPQDHDANLFDTMNYSHQYSTVYGYSFGHTGVIYGNTDQNISGMVERHWKLRTAEAQELSSLPEYGIDPTIDFDYHLMSAQSYFSLHFAESFVTDTLYHFGPFNYFSHTQEAAALLVLEKHAKQRLRAEAYQSLCDSGDIGNLLFVNTLVWKLKKMELAKFGKPARVIVDAQTGNSLPSVHISNAWKEHTSNKVAIYFSCVSIEFCSSPSPKDLERVFLSWDHYSYPVVVKNYSDDSIIGIWSQQRGCYEMYNTDIRGNDASHTGFSWSVFSSLLGMSDEHRNFLYKMLFASNQLFSRDKKSVVVFKAKYGYLPSGIGETSIANNSAMLMISWMLGNLINSGHQVKLSLVTYAAFRCGFLLSHEAFDIYSEFSKMQFLKNSPVRLPSGGCVVIPNLGRMLRYSGRSKSDVTKKSFPPPKGVDVFSWYQTLLTYGEFKKIDYPPLRKYLCPHFDLVSPSDYILVQKLREDVFMDDMHSQPVRVSRDVFYSRYIAYGLQFHMIEEFEYLISHQRLGTIVYCPLVDIVLGADYGLAAAST